jgi:putative membrane protein (TIGR04086 family)
MSMLSRIRWLRIVVGAVAVEVVLLGIAIPLNMSDNRRAILLVLVVPLCVIGSFVGAWWVARRAEGLYLLHGLLLGVLAAVIYGGLTWRLSLPTAYIVANYLKLVGGAAGGLMARMMVRTT